LRLKNQAAIGIFREETLEFSSSKDVNDSGVSLLSLRDCEHKLLDDYFFGKGMIRLLEVAHADPPITSTRSADEPLFSAPLPYYPHLWTLLEIRLAQDSIAFFPPRVTPYD